MDLPKPKHIGFPINPPTVLSGRPSKEFTPMTGKEHAEKFGDDRVSLWDVLKKARPHDITTHALEERAEREPRRRAPSMCIFPCRSLELAWYRAAVQIASKTKR